MLVWAALLMTVALPHPCTPLLVSRYSTTPVQYHIQADHGDRRYFRFQTYNGQWRKEKRLKDGAVVGAYGWTDGGGMLRLYDYTADGRGYRVVRQRSIQLNASLPLAGAEEGYASLNKVRNKYTRRPSVNSLRRNKYEKVRKSIFNGNGVKVKNKNYNRSILHSKHQGNIVGNIPVKFDYPSLNNMPKNPLGNYINVDYHKHPIGRGLKIYNKSLKSLPTYTTHMNKKGNKLVSVAETHTFPKTSQKQMMDHLKNINRPVDGRIVEVDSRLSVSKARFLKRPEQYVSIRNTKFRPTPEHLNERSQRGKVPSRKLRSRKRLENLGKVESSNSPKSYMPYGMRHSSNKLKTADKF